jgi:hypothetical protein
MPTISLTDNTNVNLTASSADDNATLNRYLKSLVTFKTPPSFAPISNLLVKDQHELDFPITLSATGEGTFAVKQTTLDIQLGGSAFIGLLQGSDESDFFSGLNLTSDPASSGLVSFSVQAMLSVGDSAVAGDFTFGITDKATLTLRSYYSAAANDKLADAVVKAVSALTIPHDIEDLNGMPTGAICRLEAASSLKFTASFTYSFLNDPLAAASVNGLPALGINATASATVEGTVTHTSGHILTVAKLPNGLLHLAVNLARTDDFETSLTVSAGVAADIGTQDALFFLLDKINPNAAAEADAIAAQMSNAAQFKSDIKSGINAALSASLAVSLKAALENSTSTNRAFIFAIDLNALDETSEAALSTALTGDFTAITRSGVPLSGITLLDSALTVTNKEKHTLALHFLGIFNAASINEFVRKSKIDFTSDTHEIVLSDETLQVVDNNLDAEKLRQLVLKDITLTLPASANTKDVANPICIAFLDREGSTSPSKMRQFVNVLTEVGAPSAKDAQSLFARNLPNYGVCALSFGLNLNPAQCRQLFIDSDGKPYNWMFYVGAICSAERTILAGDPNSADRLKLFNANALIWTALGEAGTRSNIMPILTSLGISDSQVQFVVTDVFTAIWWAQAMAAYATALAKNQPLEGVGKQVVQDANLGYNEPWMTLLAWRLTGKPQGSLEFTSSFFKPAVGALNASSAGI